MGAANSEPGLRRSLELVLTDELGPDGIEFDVIALVDAHVALTLERRVDPIAARWMAGTVSMPSFFMPEAETTSRPLRQL